jgi:WD40 repeat protein
VSGEITHGCGPSCHADLRFVCGATRAHRRSAAGIPDGFPRRPDGAVARLGTLRFKHLPGVVTKGVFSPDGKLIASATDDGQHVRLMDSATGKGLPDPWNSKSGFHINAYAFSPDGSILAIAGNERSKVKGKRDKTITLWDIASNKLLRTIQYQHQDFESALGFAEGGKTLFSQTQSSGVVREWDTTTGNEVRAWTPIDDKERPAAATSTEFTATFSPNAKYLAVYVWRGGEGLVLPEGEAVVVDLAGRAEPWRVKRAKHDGTIRFAFSADAKRVAILLGKDKVELRDTATGKLVGTPTLETKVHENLNWTRGIALSPDGSTLAISDDGHVLLWSPNEPNKFRTIKGRLAQSQVDPTQCLAFSPDGKTLLVGIGSDLQLHDVATLKEVVPSDGHRGWVDHVAFSADGTRLLTGSARLPLLGIMGGDPDFFVDKIATHAAEVATWDTAKWKQLRLTSSQLLPWPNIGVASPQHNVFVGLNGEDRFNVYDSMTGKRLCRLSVPAKQALDARGFFSPNGDFYVLTGKDGKGQTIEQLFAVPSGKLLCELPPLELDQYGPLRPLAFSSDGRLVANFGRDDGVTRVFETATGKLCHSLGTALELMHRPVPANLVFSWDSKLLACWSRTDSAIRIWDMAAGRVRMELPIKEGDFYRGVYFAWSPDGRMLAVGERDKIRLWELATLQIRREFAGHEGEIRALAFSPDGRLLASGSADTTVLIWDVWGKSSK